MLDSLALPQFAKVKGLLLRGYQSRETHWLDVNLEEAMQYLLEDVWVRLWDELGKVDVFVAWETKVYYRRWNESFWKANEGTLELAARYLQRERVKKGKTGA